MPGQLAPPVVRPATTDDVADVVRLRAASWRAAYAGIMPPAYLDAMDTGPEELARALRRFRENPAGRHCLLAERDGHSIAFVMCGPERPTLERLRGGPARGEVYSLYAHPDSWSTGAGAALLTAACARLRADGFEQQVLWVLEANARGRAFYERQGLRPTGGRHVLRLGGAFLPELEYAAAVPTGVVGPRRPAGAGATPARRGA
ncbi:GNAT family N-acetyltransferase [Streptacidiphilus sp. 4-A2]|nr:GNAT family N-acetyltransferase [Streptacidiphilus sp. 4-A2]